MAEQLVSELLAHSYYNGNFILRSIYIILCFFRSLFIQYKLLKRKKMGKKIWRLSDLAKLEKIVICIKRYRGTDAVIKLNPWIAMGIYQTSILPMV